MNKMNDETTYRESVSCECIVCNKSFNTLADEKDDTCFNCHNEAYEKEKEEKEKQLKEYYMLRKPSAFTCMNGECGEEIRTDEEMQNGRCYKCLPSFLKSFLCDTCGYEPSRNNMRFCPECREGFNEADLAGHEKG